jgi:hypothetical protein
MQYQRPQADVAQDGLHLVGAVRSQAPVELTVELPFVAQAEGLRVLRVHGIVRLYGCRCFMRAT